MRNSIEELDKKINFHRHPGEKLELPSELNTPLSEETQEKKIHSIREGISEVTSEYHPVSKRVLKLSFPDQEDVFPLVVKYMYEGIDYKIC